jgi:CHAT domain-containing protein
VYFVVGAHSTRVLVTTRDTQAASLIPVGRAALGERVLALRARLERPDRDAGAIARELHTLLLSPVLDALGDRDVTTLWLKLDDTLRYLPFAALHDGRRYLIERYALRHLHGGGAQAEPVAHARVAAFAATRAFDGFRPLPAAALEAQGIVREDDEDPAGAFPGTVWLDEAFRRDTLQQALAGGYDMLHLASHFEFSPGNEKDSFLLLGNGERLSLYELRTGDYALSGVRLLTMSGCNTALAGRDANGREIDGFATLAARKGARDILATLWPVDDATTANFMARFYALHASGLPVAQALRTAQLERRDQHPFYWAPFVLWSAPAAAALQAGAE